MTRAGEGAARIFVSIASYMDPLLAGTIQHALTQAAHPSRLRFGVVDQARSRVHETLLRSTSQIAYRRVDPIESQGPGWARSRAAGLWEAEDFFLQIDAHMRFAEGWDTALIGAWTRLAGQAGHGRVMLSNLPPPFAFDAHGGIRTRPPSVTTWTTGLDCDEVDALYGTLPVLMARPSTSARDLRGLFPCNSFVFGPGRMADALPPDPGLYFNGDDVALAIRAYTHGWEIWHLRAPPLWHLYRSGRTGERFNHWDAQFDRARQTSALDLDTVSRQRLDQLFRSQPLGAYGVGAVRSPADFWREAGLRSP